MSDYQKLCYRCEFRAQFLEDGHAPRCECGDIEHAKVGCYMYQPVKPVVLGRDKSEESVEARLGIRRSSVGGLLGARMHGIALLDGELAGFEDENSAYTYWTPKGDNK